MTSDEQHHQSLLQVFGPEYTERMLQKFGLKGAVLIGHATIMAMRFLHELVGEEDDDVAPKLKIGWLAIAIAHGRLQGLTDALESSGKSGICDQHIFEWIRGSSYDITFEATRARLREHQKDCKNAQR